MASCIDLTVVNLLEKNEWYVQKVAFAAKNVCKVIYKSSAENSAPATLLEPVIYGQQCVQYWFDRLSNFRDAYHRPAGLILCLHN